MTYIIAEPCIDIKDLSCVDVCPVDCIHTFERILVIDPEECIDCGACEPECPVEAIFPEDALPEKWEPFVKINYAYGDGADVVIADIARVEPDEVVDAWPDIPILGYTNHTDKAGLQRAHTAGFDQVIVKSALVDRAAEVVGELTGSDVTDSS